MIPLAQYLSDLQDDEFVRPRPVERRFEAAFSREPRAQPVPPRPLKAAPARTPAFPGASLAPAPAAMVPLAELEAVRAALETERREGAVRLAEARTQAAADREAELRAELGAAAESRLATLRAEHAEGLTAALAQERARWTGEQADRLADLMILQMAVFEDAMRATVKGVLKPLAMDARQRRALEELADAVRVIAPEGAEYRINATGPSDLLDKFREKLGDRADRLAVRPDEARVDIRVEADATTIETRLSAWGKALEKALS